MSDTYKPHSLHEALGLAITYWREVEDTLIEILVAAMRPARDYHVRAVWDAARHFESKLRICDSVLRYHDDKELRACWATLNNRLGRNARSRHRLAHAGSHILVSKWDDGIEREEGASLAYEFTKDGLSQEDIEQIGRAFEALQDDLRRLLSRMTPATWHGTDH